MPVRSRAPTAIPTPMPAFAPVESPGLGGFGVDVGVKVCIAVPDAGVVDGVRVPVAVVGEAVVRVPSA